MRPRLGVVSALFRGRGAPTRAFRRGFGVAGLAGSPSTEARPGGWMLLGRWQRKRRRGRGRTALGYLARGVGATGLDADACVESAWRWTRGVGCGTWCSGFHVRWHGGWGCGLESGSEKCDREESSAVPKRRAENVRARWWSLENCKLSSTMLSPNRIDSSICTTVVLFHSVRSVFLALKVRPRRT